MDLHHLHRSKLYSISYTSILVAIKKITTSCENLTIGGGAIKMARNETVAKISRHLVLPVGLEPTTADLEDLCSIH